MKKVMKVAALALALSLTGCATPEKAPAPFGDQVEVVNFPGQKAGALYNASKIWVAKAFTDANSVIQYADPATGSIVGKGNVKYACQDFTDCMANDGAIFKFTMKIDTKDNKARLTFSNVMYYRPASVSGSITFPTIEAAPGSARSQQRAREALAELTKRYKAEVLTAHADAQSNW